MFLKFASSICRVCLGPEAGVSLFADSGNDQKFMSVTNLEINENDGLPTSLCVRCSDRLESAYEFKKQSLASNSHLHSFVDTINTKFASEIENLYQKHGEVRASVEEYNLKIANRSPAEKKTRLEIDIISDCKNQSENEHLQCVQEDELVSLDYSYIEGLDDDASRDVEKHEDFVERNSRDYDESHEEENRQDFADRQSPLNVCRICNKCFSNRTNLTRHTLTHSNIKPYECPVCHSTFTQNGSLKQHMLRHTGERPHACTTCGKGFTRRRLLVMHERIHTGEKPFRCGECNLYFTVKEGLRRHNIRKHSGKLGEVYTCDICEKKLHSKYTFRNHVNLHHKASIKRRATNTSKRTTVVDNDLVVEAIKNTSDQTMDEGKINIIDLAQSDSEDDFICGECNHVFESREELMVHFSQHHSVDTEV